MSSQRIKRIFEAKVTALVVASTVEKVRLSEARFGYGVGGAIREISDPLPESFWQHPENAWSPLLSTRVPGLENVRIKYEGSHLSGSFKDRIIGATLRELPRHHPGCLGVVVPSSGNAAVAAAALCARIDLPMVAVVPAGTPDERIRPVLARGGLVVRGGEGPAAAYTLADEIAEALNYFPLHSTFSSPWSEWGCRALGREISAQLGGAPGMVVAPVSAGPVLVGAANGIREAGHTIPPMVAVQSAACAPIAQAFEAGENVVMPWTASVETKAVAIADRLTGYPQDGTRTLAVVRASGGKAVAVTDAEMADAREALFRFDGIDAEFSACAGVAWLRRQANPTPLNTVCVVTASGFKHTFAGDIPLRDRTRAEARTSEIVKVFLREHSHSATLID
jgi:threonine synthase